MDFFEVREVPVPELKDGEILIRVFLKFKLGVIYRS